MNESATALRDRAALAPDDAARPIDAAHARSWYEIVTTPAAGSFSLARRVLFILAFALMIAALNLLGSSNPTVRERLLASAIIALSAVPAWLWMDGQDPGLPLMPFFGLIFTTYYAAPLFIVRDYRTMWVAAPISHLYVARALELILLGLACVMAGYYGPQRLLLQEVLPRVTMRWRRVGNIKFYGIMFSIAGLTVYLIDRMVEIPASVAQLATFASDLCLIGMCILLVLQLIGRLDRATGLFLWLILVPLRFWFGLGSGLTSQGLIVAVTLIFTYAAIRRRIPWLVLMIGGAAFFILRPAEGAFRLMTWSGGIMQQASQLDQTRMLAQLVGQTVTGLFAGEDGATDELIQISLRRLDTDTLTFADVLRDTPGIVPYWYGATYYPLLFKPIPRFIWPGKPAEITGQSFGHRYGLLDQNNSSTSFNLPQLIEGYINFGVPGLVVSMFLFGMLYRATQVLFVHPGMGLGAVVGAVYTCVNLLQIESATSLVLGSTLWGLIFLVLLNLLIQSAELVPHPSASAIGTARTTSP
ncbi:MAG TPA: hypothetical protein VND20_10225 [Candidatus Binataceae bacterium]|nr:hypothetical protein [Candidatus Binataceae bacterium]